MCTVARSSPPLNTTNTIALCVIALAPHCAHAKLVISKTADMSFGRFAAAAGGTIVLAPSGARSSTGSVVLLNSPLTPPSSAAVFTVSDNAQGQTRRMLIITLPAAGQHALSDGTTSMPLSNFTSNLASGMTMGGAPHTLQVGATLSVAPNQPPGNYAGTVSIIVEYQ